MDNLGRRRGGSEHLGGPDDGVLGSDGGVLDGSVRELVRDEAGLDELMLALDVGVAEDLLRDGGGLGDELGVALLVGATEAGFLEEARRGMVSHKAQRRGEK